MVRGGPLIGFAIPGDPASPTGGYAYARRVLAEWARAGIEARILPLPGGFPHPTDRQIAVAEATLTAWNGPLLIDGLAYGAFPEDLAARIGSRAAVLVHHPLCDERGMDPALAARLERGERIALSHAARVVVSSPSTARDLAARFGVPDAVVALPGTDPAPRAPLDGEPPRLLSVGTVIARKGYRVLVAALASLADRAWSCTVVGATDRDPQEVDRLRAAIAAAGLGGRIALTGATEDVARHYLAADLYVSPSLHEGYGMAVVEAMAHGLPVVTTTAGALAETAPCARLVPPADADALAAGISALLDDPEARGQLGAACRAFAEGLPGWDETARIVARIAMEAP